MDAKLNKANAIKAIYKDLLKFIMESFNERMDFIFFFKTCFIELDLGFNDFRKFLIALGKA